MEEELLLKEKFNGLLESFKKGEQYVNEHPEDEKAKNRFNEIANEMQNVFNAIPNATEEDFKNGFTIISTRIEEPKQEENNTQKQNSQQMIIHSENDITNNFSNNWQIAEKLCKSSIIPKEFQGKPENVLLCMGMSKKMGLDVITVMNNLQLVMGRQEWKGSFIPVLIEKTGKYCDLEFNFVGKENSDDFGCYLEATRIRDGKRIKGTTITINMAKVEGWYNRNSKWKTMGRQMLRL